MVITQYWCRALATDRVIYLCGVPAGRVRVILKSNGSNNETKLWECWLSFVSFFCVYTPEDVIQVLGTVVWSFIACPRRWYCKIIQAVRQCTIDTITLRVLLTPDLAKTLRCFIFIRFLLHWIIISKSLSIICVVHKLLKLLSSLCWFTLSEEKWRRWLDAVQMCKIILKHGKILCLIFYCFVINRFFSNCRYVTRNVE